MTQSLHVDVGVLRELLRGELSAIESYNIAISRIANSRAAEAAALSRIASQHQEHARLLEVEILALGEVPAIESGAWGAYARPIDGSPAESSDSEALRALREGEENGLKESRAVLHNGLRQSTRELIANWLIPDQIGHVEALSALIARSEG